MTISSVKVNNLFRASGSIVIQIGTDPEEPEF